MSCSTRTRARKRQTSLKKTKRPCATFRIKSTRMQPLKSKTRRTLIPNKRRLSWDSIRRWINSSRTLYWRWTASWRGGTGWGSKHLTSLHKWRSCSVPCRIKSAFSSRTRPKCLAPFQNACTCAISKALWISRMNWTKSGSLSSARWTRRQASG